MCESVESADPYEAFAAALERFVTRTQCADRTAEELGQALVRKRHFIDLLELDFAGDAARFDATDEHEVQGFTSPITWLTNTCRMTGSAAAAAICVGEQADTLQRSVDHLRDARIGFAHLVLLARTSEALQRSGAALDEPRLLRRAVDRSPNELRRDCAHARHAGDAAAFRADEAELRDLRFLELRSQGDDHGLWITGYLDPVGGATVRAALEPLARRTGRGDDRPRKSRLADALVEMSEFTLGSGGQGGSAPTHTHVPHVMVSATLDTLLARPGAPAAELQGRIAVSTATLERLGCSANVSRVVFGPDSAVVDVGRSRRLPSPSQRRALQTRDRGCVWPGCDRPVRWTQPHHVEFWTRDGGETELPNMVVLCYRHHDNVHLGGWRIVRVDGQREVLTIPPVPLDDPCIRGPAPADIA